MTEMREFAELSFIIVTSIVFPSAFLTWVETVDSYPSTVNDGTDNSFFLQVYFVLTTMSIVGYGSSLG